MITITTHEELNRLVADKVEGWERSDNTAFHYMRNGQYACRSDLDYSRDMNAAMLAFEAAGLTGTGKSFDAHGTFSSYYAKSPTVYRIAPTPQIAICLAALRSKGIECEWRPE